MNIIKKIIPLILLGFFCQAEATTLKAERWQTRNGTPVVFYQALQVPMLDIKIAFAAGSAYDGQSFGLSALTSELLNQGNKGLSTTEIAEQLADTGAQFSAGSTRDMVELSLKTLTKKDALGKALKVFNLIMTQPDFPEKAFKREKQQQLRAIQYSFQSPPSIATNAFFKKLYQKHPYAHPILGTKDSVNNIKREDVIQFYKRYFNAQNAILVMVGAIDKKEAQNIAEQLTQNLPQGTHAPSVPEAHPLKKGQTIHIPYTSTQTVIRSGQLAIDHHNPDYFPLTVGNYILGGGSLVSRLQTQVRIKRGLTYGIYSQFLPLPGLGPFLIRFSTKNEQAANALKVTQNVLERFIEQGPDKSELIAAKKYLTGSFPLSLASNSRIASMLLKITFYRLPNNYLDTYVDNINKVSIKDINKAFHKRIDPKQFLTVSVGRK